MTDPQQASSAPRPIKDWREEDRPREKMLAQGAENLSNAELLAILIGSGTKNKSAVALMQDIMEACDNKIVLFSRLSIQELMHFNGIGQAKALTLKAAGELGRRRSAEDVAHNLTPLRSSSEVYNYMHPVCRDLACECSWVLLLNNNGRLLRRAEISRGGRTETVVDVRLVMKEAILGEATCIVLVHNHPSGNCHPSNADKMLTQATKSAAATLNITLLDHIIVSDGRYFSFRDENLL